MQTLDVCTPQGMERHHSALIVASAVTVASFVGATAYTQYRLTRLDSLSATIETNAIPSVEYLSRVAVRLTRLSDLMDDSRTANAEAATAAQSARQELDAVATDINQYLTLAPLPGEQSLWRDLRANIDRALPLARSALGQGASPESADASGGAALSDVHDALDDALGAVLATLEFDVRESQMLARQVRGVRSGTLRAIVGLDAVGTAIALVGLFVAYRASLRHDQLAREHRELLADRVQELDRFAGRMAHDVLSPLGAVAAGLGLVENSCDDRGKRHVARSREAVRRVRELVEGLLLFARAGAKPDPVVTCALDEVFARTLADCSDAASDNGISLTMSPAPHIEVRCAIGLLTSVVENLVRNAIKYMGPSQVRRITVRATLRDDVVRVEVEDTGPGIPPHLQSQIFEPFFRGPDHGSGGTGLGLATVKRLVEGHGGFVGVTSKVGSGSIFWFEMPGEGRAPRDSSPGSTPLTTPTRAPQDSQPGPIA